MSDDKKMPYTVFHPPTESLSNYDFKVHINGKTHRLVLKDDYDRLERQYAFAIGILSTMPMFKDKTISEVVKWVEDSVK